MYGRFVTALWVLAGLSAVFSLLAWRKREGPGGTPMVVFHLALAVGASSYAVDITATALSTQLRLGGRTHRSGERHHRAVRRVAVRRLRQVGDAASCRAPIADRWCLWACSSSRAYHCSTSRPAARGVTGGGSGGCAHAVVLRLQDDRVRLVHDCHLDSVRPLAALVR